MKFASPVLVIVVACCCDSFFISEFEEIIHNGQDMLSFMQNQMNFWSKQQHCFVSASDH